ncbi:prefoldin subunit 3 [[Candida] railenensis]|uniref:Prefoldin subunit 3 n=1 Tax=[Candida] railenensis TaxID=45579 RepID=A0A9P0QKP0_9ASCO|nr:prefoldin subunit 3 [[Candida] railenensis]
MEALLKPSKTNPRGIPEAPFIEKVENILKNPEADFDRTMKAFQDRLQQYKYMELSKKQQLGNLKVKIPDIEKNLEVISHIKERKAEGKDEDADELEEEEENVIETNYEVNDTLYTRAKINVDTLNSVYLWLGAEVMLEYPLDEAVHLLEERLKNNKESLKIVKEDLEFLKENITTMEVNTARLYNWDVERRKNLRLAEEKTKNLKISN